MIKTKWMTGICVAALLSGMTVNAASFDAQYYALHNTDVAAAANGDETLLGLHYELYGNAEGRAGSEEEAAEMQAKADAAALGVTDRLSYEAFDAQYYAQQNPDVAAAVGTDKDALYIHYLLCGAAEGRGGSAAETAAANVAEKKETTAKVQEDPYARFATTSASTSHHKSSKNSDDSANDTSLPVACAHKNASWNLIGYRGNTCYHAATCPDCGEYIEEACVKGNYSFTRYRDDLKKGFHNASCVRCTQVWQSLDCEYEYTDKAEATHTKKCILCQNEQTKAHDYAGGTCRECGYTCKHLNLDQSSWQKDADDHWKECDACGEKCSKSTHSYDGNDQCICGATKSSEPSE